MSLTEWEKQQPSDLGNPTRLPKTSVQAINVVPVAQATLPTSSQTTAPLPPSNAADGDVDYWEPQYVKAIPASTATTTQATPYALSTNFTLKLGNMFPHSLLGVDASFQ